MCMVFMAQAHVQMFLLFAVGISCCACIVVAVLASFRARRSSERSGLRREDSLPTESCICREKHDVFLSFRGEDTRRGFTSHLYDALDQIKIQAYIDYKLETGDEIAPALLEAISKSKISVIIFSKNYASSRWCLDELVHILKCRDSQFVVPVFYDVDPAVVRHQLGSYADAFVVHKKRFEDHKLKAWREALKIAANISGFDLNSKEISTEAELVKRVVKDVLEKLDRKSQIQSGLEGLVGIEKHVQNVESLLCLESDHVIRTVGIWGMGGIGKTTIADVVFHRCSYQFKALCLIENVRERSETRQGLHELRDEMLSTLLKEENVRVASPSIGSVTMRQRLSRTKALVVLDDVSDLNQVEFLVGGDCILFGPGSRIIRTARNKRILGADDAMIYEVAQLHDDVALDLFHSRALKNLSPTMDYATLSREVVGYAGGNPLALTVLGALFSHCRSIEDWKAELEKLKRYPDRKIQNALRLSYDGLEKNEADIFLDIACFHKEKHFDETKRMLENCGFSVHPGLRLLTDMALISIDKKSRRLQMHDLIQEMGHKIVYGECDDNPGKRSRLWLASEVGPVLQKKRGTENIECIVMNMDDLVRDLHVNVSSFGKMESLRILDIHSSHFRDSYNCRRHFGLRAVCLPPNKFSSENLVELIMPNSRLERLWNKDVQIDLGSIKHINLSSSKLLVELPDLCKSPNLESINLEGCSSMVQLPSSFQHHAKLTSLNFEECSSLKILPQMPSSLIVLQLSDTAIEELPSSVWSLKNLVKFNITFCGELKIIESSIPCRLTLTSLDLSNCRSLKSLPVELPAGLESLNLFGCKNLTVLPVKLPARLKNLILKDCENLTSLPVELPVGTKVLELNNCRSLVSLSAELPDELGILCLIGCKNLKSLPMLPWFVQNLEAHGFTSLETVSSSSRIAPVQGWDLLSNENIDFQNCPRLDQAARSNIMADAQFRMIRCATLRCPRPHATVKVLCPGNEIPRWLRYQNEGNTINVTLPSHPFCQGFLGYALCIVFEMKMFRQNSSRLYLNQLFSGFSVSCKIHHQINGVLDILESVPTPVSYSLNTNHVFAWNFCPEYVGSETTICCKDLVEASFDFRLYLHKIGKEESYPLEFFCETFIERCGVSLLYAQDFDPLFGGVNGENKVVDLDFFNSFEEDFDESEMISN